MFYWKASSDDGAFEDVSEKGFETEKEAYEDMRNAALEKMKWNTEYDEDFDDGFEDFVKYKVKFKKNKIIHKSFSGKYTYKIYESDFIGREIKL